MLSAQSVQLSCSIRIYFGVKVAEYFDSKFWAQNTSIMTSSIPEAGSVILRSNRSSGIQHNDGDTGALNG